MITIEKKNEIKTALVRERNALGSMNKVANKLNISAATISANLMKPENWGLISDVMWTDVAGKLGVRLIDRSWNMVQTTNLQTIHNTLSIAQQEAFFMAISERAGSGKTSAIGEYAARNAGVYVLQCEDWNYRLFLQKLASALGIHTGGYDTSDYLMNEVIRFFKQKTKESFPLLVLDEADKLKPSALRFLIPLYNRLEDEVGVVICGADNLKKEIRKGANRAVKGYDEVDSRLGRTFVSLPGATKKDVADICLANGVTDPVSIERIWNACAPRYSDKNGVKRMVVDDLRAVRRQIKAERISLRKSA